jgi:hypothetical protein
MITDELKRNGLIAVRGGDLSILAKQRKFTRWM